MSGDIVQLVEQASPYLTAAVSAYGGAVLARAEDTAVEATANLGRRILQTVWRRRTEPQQTALEAAVQDAAEAPDDPDAAAALRQQIKRALREDAELLAELAALLPAPAAGTVTITASGDRSIAAQHIGNAHTGDVIGLPAEILTAARDVPAPHGLANLPPVPLCLGRDEALREVRATLAEQNGTAITQASTVHGLGGIGKTTLALAYAHQQRHTYSLVWWINADSPTRLEQSLGDLALKLFPAWAGTASQDQRSAWATTWLQWHPGWLLVFDNVETPADLHPYLGALDGGHHLITSRRATGWPRTIHTQFLGTLHPDEAADLICTHAITNRTPTPRDRQAAHALAADLGHLPLALEQAGAYLAQNPTISIDTYRHRLTTKLDKAADGLNAERTIARIWTQTLHALTARNPLAVDTLHTIAWLAPDNIPILLLETPGTDTDDLAEALGLLAAYSMTTLTPNTISVHRLLQTVLRTTAPTNPDGSPAGRHEAEQALTQALPEPTTGPAPEWDTLIPHLTALATTTPPTTTTTPPRSTSQQPSTSPARATTTAPSPCTKPLSPSLKRFSATPTPTP
ncbi:NB-ARC domain-containing protein [Streptomyces sp. TLI_053]|uniref:NB-ARC domain-containing protein n=1 Tax=Streptomyces sp. TLI_053 TaxID=1855352 RepID=UPI000D19FD1B|nr:NB-ARC domain-containing protein [Streptomyces sp. TLI_053]